MESRNGWEVGLVLAAALAATPLAASAGPPPTLPPVAESHGSMGQPPKATNTVTSLGPSISSPAPQRPQSPPSMRQVPGPADHEATAAQLPSPTEPEVQIPSEERSAADGVLVLQRPKGFPTSQTTPRFGLAEPSPPVGDTNAISTPPVPPPAVASRTPANLHKDTVPSSSKPIEHRGFVLEALIGTLGCTRSMCSGAEGHDGKPGVSVAGFLGGNIAGFVDLGVEGGWGRLRADVPENTNALSLYGIDIQQLEQAVSERLGIPGTLMNFATLSVDDARMDAARGGLAIRVHFIPRGRVTAFVGSGAQYQLVRSTYGSERGTSQVDLHGIAVPISGGFGVHVHRHIALMARFDYLWSRHLLLRIDDPQTQFVAPIAMIQDVNPSTDLNKTLPHFWHLGLGMRTNF